jgi:TRAP transporter TAXI family solute receptor
MILRDIFNALRPRLLIGGIAAALLVAAALWAVVVFLRPLPPRTVTMATGPEGGAYHEVGKRYRELLAREGIELRLLPTAGVLENLARLRDSRSKVDVGFLQVGITSEKESPDLESLGMVFYEPLWFFRRSSYQGRGLESLRGRKISIGPEGSETRTLTLELLARNGLDQSFARLLSLAPHEAADQLLRNEIDAALMVTSWDAPAVRRLLADQNVELVSFPRTDAYIAFYPFLSKVVVPAGLGDMAKNRPPSDAVLFALKACLVARQDLHPAIQYLLLEAAEKIHSGPGIFNKAGHFPLAEAIDLPLSDEAREFYRSGRPFLQRHLPFWLAVLIGRLLILIIPVAGVIYPLVHYLPALYGWEMKRRIFRLYGELRFLEQDLESRRGGQSTGDLRARLDRLEKKANSLRVPVSYSNMLYSMRSHIRLVRESLKRAGGSQAED